MKKLIAYLRMAVLILSMIGYLIIFFLVLPFKRNNLGWGLDLRLHWMRAAHLILGIQVDVRGELPDKPGLLVANHQAAIDPLVVMRFARTFAVGKHEIRSYPLIGFAGEKTGTLYVKREEKDHRKAIRDAIKNCLIEENSVLVFPEGTVNYGRELLPFKPGAFQSALEAGSSIVPVSIRYSSQEDIWQEGDGLLKHFIRQVGKKNVRVRLTFHQPIRGENAIELSVRAREVIREGLTQL